jgi:hypothetical protein
MMQATLCLCVPPATQKSLLRKEAAGEGRGGQDLCDLSYVQRAWGNARKKYGSKGRFKAFIERR